MTEQITIEPMIRLEVPGIEPKSGSSWTLPTWREFFGCIEQAGLWLDYRFESALGSGRYSVISGLDEVIQSAPTWKSGNHTFTQAKKSSDLDQYLNVGVPPNDYRLQFGSQLELLGQLRNTFIDQVAFAITCLHKLLSPENWLRPGIGVWVDNLDYPRPRPPRRDNQIRASALLDAISLAYVEREDADRRAKLEALINTPLPPGGQRTEQDGLVLIRWIEDLTDKTLIAKRMSIREQWINAILQPSLEAGFSAEGDREIYPIGLVPLSPLTLYEPGFARGFKAVYTDAQGNFDEDELNELTEFLRQGKLPDGSLLKELYLIAPDRNRAIAIHDRAKEVGVSAVYYPSKDGSTWYDPFPLGLWLDQGSDSP